MRAILAGIAGLICNLVSKEFKDIIQISPEDASVYTKFFVIAKSNMMSLVIFYIPLISYVTHELFTTESMFYSAMFIFFLILFTYDVLQIILIMIKYFSSKRMNIITRTVKDMVNILDELDLENRSYSFILSTNNDDQEINDSEYSIVLLNGNDSIKYKNDFTEECPFNITGILDMKSREAFVAVLEKIENKDSYIDIIEIDKEKP